MDQHTLCGNLRRWSGENVFFWRGENVLRNNNKFVERHEYKHLLSSLNSKRCKEELTPRHVTVRLAKDKEQIWKSAKEKPIIMYKGFSIRL